VILVILVILVVFVLIVTGVGSTFDDWLQQEGREPRSGRGAALRPLQLPRGSDAPRDARDAAGLTGRVWEIADLIGLLDAADKKAA
jgi:hypothetical protein